MYSDYYNNYYGNYYNGFGAAFGFVIGLLIVLSIFILAVSVFYIICYWKIFKKAGKNGWEALIPYYSSWIFFEISGYPGWLALIGLASVIPYVGFLAVIAMFVLNILACISLAKKFHKSEGFGVLLALLPIVGFPILAFSKDTYDASLGEQNNLQQNDTVETNTTTETKTTTPKFCGNCGTKVSANAKVCSNCGNKLQ